MLRSASPRLFLCWLPALAASLSPACSHPGTGLPEMGSVPDLAKGPPGVDGGRDAGTCPPGRGYGGGEASLQVTSASGTVVDASGTAVAGVPVQLCGLNLCFSGKTGAGGAFLLSANASLKHPMLRFGDALSYAELAAPITMATTTFPRLLTAALPQAGAPLSPGGSATSGGVTVTLPPGGTAVVDALNYDTADKQRFRAAQVPVDNHQEDAVPGVAAYGLELVYGVAPIETVFCPPARITVPNSQGWRAGAAVEFWVHGVDVLQEWSPYGGWVKLSDGQVSTDGATVETADGQGFPVLETFGVRLR